MYEVASDEQQKFRRREVLEKLVRYRPSSRQAKELFAMGHDNLELYFGDTFKRANDPEISYFYGGIGDQRNLFRLLLDFNNQELNKGAPKRKYHLTVVDINPCTLARNLIVLKLLDKLSKLDHPSDAATDILTTLFHLWASYLMLPSTFSHLQKAIATILKALKSGEQVIEWLHIPEEDKSHYITVLQEWEGEHVELHTNQDFVTKLVERNEQRTARDELMGARRPDNSVSYRQEQILFTQTGVIFPPLFTLNAQDPVMANVFHTCDFTYSKYSDGLVNSVKQHLIRSWKINVTLLSREWYRENGWAGAFICDPYLMVDQICFEGTYPKKPVGATKLYDYVTPLFIETAAAIANLRGRFCVEAVLGDCVDVMEKLKFGLYNTDYNTNTNQNGQKQQQRSYRPAEFPILYDRFHLSNVPDYIGGHLSTFLHATPLLKPRPTSVITSCCMRNALAYTSVLHYIADHNCIGSVSSLEKLTNTTTLRDATMQSHLKFYNFYQLTDTAQTSFKRPFSELLPKEDTQRWLLQLFWKIVAPYKCNPRKATEEVHAALNLTVFFRMLTHLHTIGYPAHWLSTILQSILTGTVTTAARPPRENPNTIEGVSKVHPKKKLSTMPFKQEVATLTQLFSPLLPFSLPTGIVIPKLESIRKYTFYLSSYPIPRYRTLTNLLLVFYDPTIFCNNLNPPISDHFPMDPSISLRSFVDEDWIDTDEAKKALDKTDLEKIREEGLVVWTTFEFDVKTLLVKVWLGEGLVEEWKEKGWGVGIWRVDEWAWACESVHKVGDVVKIGERWVGGDDGSDREEKLAGEMEKLGLLPREALEIDRAAFVWRKI